MACRGYPTQFDATHETNVGGHNLFSFLVGDKYGIYIPAAHAVVERESSQVLQTVFMTLRRVTAWSPCYILTDNTVIQQLAVRDTFPGLVHRQLEITHLLYTIHSMQTLMKHFKGHPEQAMFSYTKP